MKYLNKDTYQSRSWDLLVLILGTFLGFISSYVIYKMGVERSKSIRSEKSQLRKKESAINILNKAPEMSYEWFSNYSYLAYLPYGSNTKSKSKKCNLVLEIKNKGTKRIIEPKYSVHVSFDPKMLRSPYDTVKSRKLYDLEVRDEMIKPGESITLNISNMIRDKFGGLEFLMPGEESEFFSVEKNFNARKRGNWSAVVRNVSEDIPKVSIGGSDKFILYLRIYERYRYEDVSVSQMYTGSVGRSYVLSKSGTTPGMHTHSHIKKSSYTLITRNYNSYKIRRQEYINNNNVERFENLMSKTFGERFDKKSPKASLLSRRIDVQSNPDAYWNMKISEYEISSNSHLNNYKENFAVDYKNKLNNK